MSFRFGFGSSLVAVLLAGALLPISGCGKAEPGKIRVAFVSNNAHEFWTYAERGSEKAARDFDVEVLFRRPPNGTPQEQQDEVKNLLLKGVKGIAVSPNDAANQAEFYNDVAAKVSLITQDSDLPAGSKRLCYLGTDNYGAGKAVGQMVKEVLPEGGQVLVLVGSLDVLNAQLRRQGVLDELAGSKDARGPQLGKFELIDTFTDDTNRAICKTKVDNFLVKFKGDPAKLCIVGLWAYNPPAALEAVKNAKLEGKIKLVGFDEDRGTLDGIEQGFIQGTVVQQPFKFGYEAVRILAGLAKGDKSVLPEGGELPIPFKVIKKGDVQSFRTELDELLKKPGSV
jgi:ribose transport system substrate-binding protein